MDGRIPATAFALALVCDGRAVAQIVIEERDTCPSHLLGSLPPTELVVTELRFEPDTPDSRVAAMVAEALRTAPSQRAEYVRYRINPEFAPLTQRTKDIVGSAGMELFCEKQGLELDLARDAGADDDGDLDFACLADVGDEAFVPIVASVGIGTLDRNDQWFHERAGAINWARVFLSMCAPTDRTSWLIGIDRAGDPVGFIGVSEMEIDDPTPWDSTPCGTITMTGVVPVHRGRGHIQTILREGITAARRRGFAVMLDSVDVLNIPMRNAMTRCGYRDDTRPWHDWFFRAPVGR